MWAPPSSRPPGLTSRYVRFTAKPSWHEASPPRAVEKNSLPQLPCWYELWTENGVYPGQPAVDFMIGPLPSNLTPVRWGGRMQSKQVSVHWF